MSSASLSARFENVAIVGVGLIGGSIAAALKLRGIAKSIIGVGRNRDRLEAAREAGIIDRAETSIDATDTAELVIVCTPVDRIAEDVKQAASLGAGTLITDAGSVKASICDAVRGTLPDGVTFVGSHPLAGSEKTGWENGQADLFVDRPCVITPEDDSPTEAVDRIEAFWQAIGMRTRQMSAEEHDRAVAATSHVPHVAASAIVSLINDANANLASTGFRDATRIAAGDPSLWLAILKGNKAAVISEIDRLMAKLEKYRHSLDTEDFESVWQLMATAKQRRDSLDF